MAYNLLPCDGEQDYLMPPSLKEWLGEGHLSWFVVDAVSQMDLSEFYTAYRNDGWGAAAYDPGMMVLPRKDCMPTAGVSVVRGRLPAGLKRT